MSQLPTVPPQDDKFETVNHNFVVELHLEASGEPRAPGVWRGRITHIPSDCWRHVQSIDEIAAFIQTYLQARGDSEGPEFSP